MDQNDKGKVLFDGEVVTMKNGFFEIWLPRNRKINLSIKSGLLTATGMVETFSNSKTCETTFQLH